MATHSGNEIKKNDIFILQLAMPHASKCFINLYQNKRLIWKGLMFIFIIFLH